jgi:protease II
MSDDKLDIVWDREAQRYSLLSWNKLLHEYQHVFHIENQKTHQIRPADESAVEWIVAELQAREKFAASFPNEDAIKAYYIQNHRRAMATRSQRRKEAAREERQWAIRTNPALRDKTFTEMGVHA